MDTLSKTNKYTAAEAQLARYKELKAEKANIDAHMKNIKGDLEEFAHENRGLMTEGKLEMEHGTLRFGTKTTVKLGDKFNLRRAFEKAAEYLNFSVSVAAVKSAYQTTEGVKKMKSLHIQLNEQEVFTID